jgi:hypothetical protein
MPSLMISEAPISAARQSLTSVAQVFKELLGVNR